MSMFEELNVQAVLEADQGLDERIRFVLNFNIFIVSRNNLYAYQNAGILLLRVEKFH